MIDFHCHFLPGIDDGAIDAAEGAKILSELKKQDVSLVCATPHFRADYMSVDEFLSERRRAFDKMSSYTDGVEIVLGAEVYITPELFKIDSLERLCMENTNTILLEMPYGSWQQWMFDLIMQVRKKGIVPVIAHAERYFEGSLFKYKRFFEGEDEIYMQFNADSFISIFQRKAMNMLLGERLLPVLGSDSHDMRVRKPRMDKAFAKIKSKFKPGLISEMETNAARLLNK